MARIGVGGGKLTVNGHAGSLGVTGDVLQLDRGDGCTTVLSY